MKLSLWLLPLAALSSLTAPQAFAELNIEKAAQCMDAAEHFGPFTRFDFADPQSNKVFAEKPRNTYGMWGHKDGKDGVLIYAGQMIYFIPESDKAGCNKGKEGEVVEVCLKKITISTENGGKKVLYIATERGLGSSMSEKLYNTVEVATRPSNFTDGMSRDVMYPEVPRLSRNDYKPLNDGQFAKTEAFEALDSEALDQGHEKIDSTLEKFAKKMASPKIYSHEKLFNEHAQLVKESCKDFGGDVSKKLSEIFPDKTSSDEKNHDIAISENNTRIMGEMGVVKILEPINSHPSVKRPSITEIDNQRSKRVK